MMNFKTKPNSEAELLNILHPLIKEWFFTKFKEFSLPQLFGVMEIHSRNNVLVSAPTGATKTLTGFLSILNELIDSSEKGILEDKVYCVYISPLKALSNDIQKNLNEPLKEMEAIHGRELGIRVAVRTGDTTASEKSKMAKKPPHILITTPESLAIMLSSIKFRDHLSKVEWCIVDEIHSLAENKRGVHLSLSMERLQRLSGHVCRVGLSATVAPLENVAKFLVGRERDHYRQCKIVDVQFIKSMDLKVLCPVPDLIDSDFETMHHGMYVMIDDLVQSHKTTLIFTNTRSATERVVDHLKDKFPKNYADYSEEDTEPRGIGAHHGSLSKEMRLEIEERLRQGKLKCVVSSTSLELGIDIGFIDLVICLGSPKSVARFLQRAGRAGHRFHETVKARIIVLDRDDLVECSVLLKSAIEKKIDRIHIPKNCLDVLAQQIFGIAISEKIHVEALFELITNSYCYETLDRKDFEEILAYLAGEFSSLEDRNIYAKIWYDRESGLIGRRGKMARVLYMTNIGTIPDETRIKVKMGEQLIGTIDEAFLDRLRQGDVFVLGGQTYEFRFSRGTTAQVVPSSGRPPTIPSWYSEMLPLSFDLANEIGRFRRLIEDKFKEKKSKDEILKFINEHLYVDHNSANGIYNYLKEHYDFAKKMPSDRRILVEYYDDERQINVIFHTMFGRRVNDCLSRAMAYVVSRLENFDVEMGITDNGFYLGAKKRFDAGKAFKILKPEKLDLLMRMAIDKTEVLRRRFRHCATRSLMILRTYRGRTKKVGRQQISSQILINALKRINPDFSIIKEARREVLEDLMDIESTKLVLQQIIDGKIKVEEINTMLPSPLAFNLVLQGYTDMLKIDDRIEFLKRMHQMILAKIGKGD
ncbi:ATP-dependent helicase [Candidatus Woesearchaeota archaeon]|nr:ATP-dependent helicase [Candidatus Woesearchaeota archaeon]